MYCGKVLNTYLRGYRVVYSRGTRKHTYIDINTSSTKSDLFLSTNKQFQHRGIVLLPKTD